MLTMRRLAIGALASALLGLNLMASTAPAIACDGVASDIHHVRVTACRQSSASFGTPNSRKRTTAPRATTHSTAGVTAEAVVTGGVWLPGQLRVCPYARLCRVPFPAATDSPRASTPPAPVQTVTRVATQIATELEVPAPTPRIGPNPENNRWKMIPVGYPIQLWTDSRATIDRAASAQGLTVSLHATPGSTTFTMGDGNSTRCTDQPPWTGTPSGSCHYRYSTPSRPGTPYTITATTTWTVQWQAGSVNGTVTVRRAATTQLTVGELQAIVDTYNDPPRR